MLDVSQTGLVYPALYFIHVDWCGHCRRATPILEDVSDRLGKSLPVIRIDGDRYKEMINQRLGKVRSYPTILYVNTVGQVTKFDGERSVRSIIEFVCSETSKTEGHLEACRV